MKAPLLRTALALALMLPLAACDSAAPSPSGTLAGAEPAAARTAQVDVCHATGDGYRSVAVAPSAVEGHRRHGDGLPGDPVPGQPGWTFGSDCVPTDQVPACFLDLENQLAEDGVVVEMANLPWSLRVHQPIDSGLQPYLHIATFPPTWPDPFYSITVAKTYDGLQTWCHLYVLFDPNTGEDAQYDAHDDLSELGGTMAWGFGLTR